MRCASRKCRRLGAFVLSGWSYPGKMNAARVCSAHLFDKIPDGPMKDALRDQDPAFAEEMAQRWLDGDEATRADIEAFFESDGPRMVHEAKLKHEDGTPTTGPRLLRAKEDFEERAGILQYDKSGLSREDAEAAAERLTRERWERLS